MKTRLEKLAELPENIAKLALANAAKEQSPGFLSYQKEKEKGFDDAIGYCFLWSKSKEGAGFWAAVSDYLDECPKKLKRIIPGPKNIEYQPFLVNNTLHVGCQRFPLKTIQSFFAKWDGKPGQYGQFLVTERLVFTSAKNRQHFMPIGEVKKIGTWIKKIP